MESCVDAQVIQPRRRCVEVSNVCFVLYTEEYKNALCVLALCQVFDCCVYVSNPKTQPQIIRIIRNK